MEAYTYGHYTYALIYFLILFTSGSFHACDQGYTCLFSFQTQKDLDYIFAGLILPLTALYLIHWERSYMWAPLQRWFIILFALLISLLVVKGWGSELSGQAVIAGVSLAVVVGYWIGYAVNAVCIEYPAPPALHWCWSPDYDAAGVAGRYFPKYEWGALLAGTALTSIGVYLFISQGTFLYTWGWVTHSMWHILAAFGQYFIIQCKAPVDFAQFRVLDAKMDLYEQHRPEIEEAISQHLEKMTIGQPMIIKLEN